MELIKIELDHKIFKIPKPRTFDELQAKLSSKFGKTEMHKRLVCYKDTDNEEVIIETDGDIEIALMPNSKVEKLLLKALPEVSEASDDSLKKEDLGRLFTYIDSLIDHEKLKKVESCVDNNLLPCPRCFSSRPGAGGHQATSCKECHGTGHRRLTSIWNLILFLIDCKIKEFILNPISDLNLETSSGSLKDEIHEKNSTQLSLKLENNCISKSALNLNSKHPPDIFNQSELRAPKVLADDARTRGIDSSLFDNSFNPKSFKKQNTFVGASSSGFGLKAKNVNLSFPNAPLNVLRPEEEEKFYTKEQLYYGVMEAEAWLSTSNTVEVRLLLEGVSQKSWPLGVRVRGKECDITRGVDVALEKRLRPSSIIGIKFNFSVKSDLTDRIMREPLCFEFYAIDNQKNIKYFSQVLKIRLNIKKSSKINVCSIVK